jgi:hypothetical protein
MAEKVRTTARLGASSSRLRRRCSGRTRAVRAAAPTPARVAVCVAAGAAAGPVDEVGPGHVWSPADCPDLASRANHRPACVHEQSTRSAAAAAMVSRSDAAMNAHRNRVLSCSALSGWCSRSVPAQLRVPGGPAPPGPHRRLWTVARSAAAGALSSRPGAARTMPRDQDASARRCRRPPPVVRTGRPPRGAGQPCAPTAQ